ncbi:MAG: CehA/McbA family metallohydrolase [Gemmatimonadaceae bacterium]|nr:CehA/McbA family metallohydrolase [Gemmatimonadaceae bacterium]
MPTALRALRVLAALLPVLPSLAGAQWTNRYPRNAGYGHHVYLEGYELPILSAGVTDFAESSSGEQVIASRGWLWRFDAATGVARRLTSGGGVDSRPAWSPDSRTLAFVRDDSHTLAVIVRDMASGRETEVDRGMAMDPTFTPDGTAIVYTNVAAGGDLDLWRYDLASRSRTRLTSDAGIELRPLPLPDGQRLVYLSKSRAADQVRLRTLATGQELALLQGNIVSQTRPALSPDGARLAFNWPGTSGWELRLSSTDRPGVSILLVGSPGGRPIAPAWSADGRLVYFHQGDARQVARLYRVPAVGGRVEEVAVAAWDWQAPTGRIVIETRCASCAPATGLGADGDHRDAARLSVTDAAGHPLIPAGGMARFEGQNGRVFFYSPGTITLEVPVGAVTVRAVRGLATREQVVTVVAVAGEDRTGRLDLVPLWEAQRAGWFSGDHHFHLNYGGPFALRPGDLLPLMQGEDLDVAMPMLANLHNRFEEQETFDWKSLGSGPLVRWAQEVRSHFLGHVGLLGTSELFWPWVWGPGYEVNGRDDRLNAEPLAFARRQGGAGYYVHPVSGTRAPFSEAGMNALPVALVADAAHGMIDLLEVVCLWSNSVGTTELWYRFLNAGFPVAPSGGTDVMTDLHRTMAVGTTRVYVRPDGPFNWASYFAALKAGRSFVTTGPLVDLQVGAQQPGDVIADGEREVAFTLGVYTAVPVDSVALVVNGRTVWSGAPPDSTGRRTYAGTVRLPAGGWVAARVVGPDITQWPAMAEYAFAHTAPIWIGRTGSTEPGAQRAAAADLLAALGAAERRLATGYAGTEIPALSRYFIEARTTLELLAR